MLRPIRKPILTTHALFMKTTFLKRPWRGCGTTALGYVLIAAGLLATSNLMATNTNMPVVTTLGGGMGTGYIDDCSTLYAQFHTPIGLAIDSSDNYLFVADRDNNAVRWLDLTYTNTFTFVPNDYVPTNLIQHPVGVAIDGFDDVFVLNRGNGSNGTVLEFDWYTGDLIVTNATGLTNAAGIALDPIGNIYVTVNSNMLIQITPGGVQTTIATIPNVGTSLKGIVVKHNGLVAACDFGNNGIWLIDPTTTNSYSQLTGFNGAGDNFITGTHIFPYNTGVTKAHARFNQPYGVAEAGDGTLIVTDCGNNRVKIANSAGTVNNFYGVNSYYWWTGTTPPPLSLPAVPGWSDGTVLELDQLGDVQARLPVGICFSSDGTLYTTEDYYHIIRKVISSLTPPLPPKPTVAPIILNVTTNYGQITLTWSPVANATSYNVKRSQTSGTETTIATVSTNSYTDTTVFNGQTYYYVVSAVNAGGEGPPSNEVSATPPLPPITTPQIGWVQFVPDASAVLRSVFHAGSSFTFNNDEPIVIVETDTTSDIAYNYGATAGGVPDPTTNSTSAQVGYVDNLLVSQVIGIYTVASIMPDMTIKAIGWKSDGSPNSAIVSARFQFIVGNPIIAGNNAAQFTINDITSGAQLWYTTDGSDPTNVAPSQLAGTIAGTNGITLSLSLPTTNMTFKVRGFKVNYQPSAIVSNVFSISNFLPNTISFGFASGEASSDFVGAPGQTFYAPVTLSVLPKQTIYSMQFNVTVTNVGSAPSITPNAFSFQSMLIKPIPGITPVVYTTILPEMFVSGTSFTNLVFTNSSLNLLGVGWLERAGKTNLYDTTKQTLITYSQARDNMFPNSNQPNGVMVGSYSFQVPINATPGQTYQIQIGRPSATSDGIGAPGSSVYISTPTNGSLTAGAINSIKLVTAGQRKYLVGDVYPFNWFNAGDFGTGDLAANGSPDVEQVFESAIYYWNYPPPRSDFFDAMDSCGNIGTLDGSTGYYTNNNAYPIPFNYSITNWTYTYDVNTNLIDTSSNILSFVVPIYIDTTSVLEDYTITSIYPAKTNVTQFTTTYYPPPNPYVPNLFDGNDVNINQIIFGDGVLDVCDVYVTFRRSLDSSLTWYRRFWTNGVLVAETTPNVLSHSVVSKSSPAVGKTLHPAVVSSVTNQPRVNFACADLTASAGQIVQIPITAKIFGDYPLRVLMLNLTVVPLDGSPALTTPVTFSYNPALGTPWMTDQRGNGNYAAAWLTNGIAGLTGDATLGTLTVTIPANATSASAYAVHFDHASASPNGLASFPKQTLTGLITLADRSSSSYNDGIPDSWRLRYFGTVNNLLSVSNACPSGDGINNWQKYVAGVDPFTPNDFPSLNPKTPVPAGATAAIHWPTVSSKQYVILRSSSLFPGSWSAIATNTGTGTDMEFDDSASGSVHFYRVQVLQQ